MQWSSLKFIMTNSVFKRSFRVFVLRELGLAASYPRGHSIIPILYL